MDNTFLPEGYEQPEGNSNYLKLQKGDNKFRILSRPVVGWVDWKDKKPFRFAMNAKPDKPFDPKKPIKHFWAFLVWDATNEGVKILELTQQTIQQSIGHLSKDEEWGAPFEYDIKVGRKGEGLETEYTVTPSPKKPLTDDIKKAALEKPCNLEALFSGSDPWVVTDKQTELAFTGLPF